MVYFDYSATTPVDEKVLDTFLTASLDFVGNPNSLHQLGVKSKQLIDSATEQIANLLHVKKEEIIYTSGSSESNNLAIKGICYQYQNRGKHIITTQLEHSSIYGPIGFLQKQGFTVDFVSLDSDGLVNIDNLKELLREDTILVSISSVNSETGVRQPIEKIGEVLKEYPKCFFHVDATQSVGKVEVDFQNVDLVSFSAHKFYGIKGIGCLIKRENISIEPLIHGGKSTTIYRSGTPCVALIASLAKALRLALENLDEKQNIVMHYNEQIREFLQQFSQIKINSNSHSIPHILNFSVLGMKPETLQHALEEYGIYISTQSACATGNISKAVFAITRDEKRALSSVRVSLSYKTTNEELEEFYQAMNKIMKRYFD